MTSTCEHWLRRNFNEVLRLPFDAVEWLIAAWHIAQVFDDFADGDPVERDCLDAAIMDALVNMPANPFFERNRVAILPVLALSVLKWKASDTAERDGKASAMSYAWRAGYYDLVLLAVHLTHGPESAMNAAHMVMSLYGETYADYMKEMETCQR
jgi:hypothetical protein